MRFWTLAIILLISLPLSAQKSKKKKEKPPKEDLEAAELIFEGKKALQSAEYDWARIKFKQALDRPKHQGSSAALYLLGLSYYLDAERERAHLTFDSLIYNFPQSRYVADARYNKGLMFLEEERDYAKLRGLNLLNWVADSAWERSLREDARAKIRAFAFEAEEGFIRAYLDAYDAGNRLLFVEALCYQYLERGDRDRAKDIYRSWRREGGETSDYLIRLFDKRRQKRRRNRDEFKVAVFLPLDMGRENWLDTLVQIPRSSRLGLEFYEGLKLALEEEEYHSKGYTFRIFDTERDSQKVEDLLYELNDYYPDLVLGSVFNTQSQIVSKWAERTGTPQIVPLSPSPALIEDKTFTFLATPEIQVHGRVMAKYAWDSLQLKKVVVWNNQEKNTNAMAQAFSEDFQRMGGTVINLLIEEEYELAKKEIPDLVRSLRFQEVEGVYIPILKNEESCGLILSELRAQNLEVKVMGGPHWWKRYSTIDESLKESFGLVFTSSYFTQNQDPYYQRFYQDYLQEFHLPPGEFSIQGYDLGKYLLHVLENYRPSSMDLTNYLRNHPPYRGLHLNYDFRAGQSNAYLNIGGYFDGRVIKLNDTELLEFDKLGDR